MIPAQGHCCRLAEPHAGARAAGVRSPHINVEVGADFARLLIRAKVPRRVKVETGHQMIGLVGPPWSGGLGREIGRQRVVAGAAGSTGEMNFASTGVAAPKAALSRVARYSVTALLALGSS
jgi:hypothetical protein